MRYFILSLMLLWLVPITVSQDIRIGSFVHAKDDDNPINFDASAIMRLLYAGGKHWTNVKQSTEQ